MSKVVNIEEVIENNVTYVIEMFDNGTKVKTMKSENVEKEEFEPTETELYQAETLLNQIEIMTLQQAQDEVLAEILLNQLGV